MAIYLIDYENTKNLIGVNNLSADDNIIIFYSQNANTLSFDIHQEIMSSKAKIEYKCVDVGARNALDFQLSSYLGYLIKENENSVNNRYFIVSKDTDFSLVKSFWKKEKSIDIQIVSNLAGKVQNEDFDDKNSYKKIETLLKKSELKLSDKNVKEIIAILKKNKTTLTINNSLNKLLQDSKKNGSDTKNFKAVYKKTNQLKYSF